MENFNEAIDKALLTWYPKDHPLHFNPHHPLGKLCGEWGELLDDYMKSIYKPDYRFEPENELGDIWYYTRILAYQRSFQLSLKEIEIKETNEDIDILMSIVINEISFAFFAACRDIEPDTQFISLSYNIMMVICNAYNITLEQLTASNWEKLKPGSERGEQWARARAKIGYVNSGKIGEVS